MVEARSIQVGRVTAMVLLGIGFLLFGGGQAKALGQQADQEPRQRRVAPQPDKQRTRPPRSADEWRIEPRNIPPKMKLASFRSNIINDLVNYLVYLPPDYGENPTKRYPVIYWLPGLRGDCRECADMVQVIDGAIQTGEMPPVIVVAVQGIYGSMYTNARDGGRPIESVIMQELIGRVDGTFRTIPQREYRGIEGFDMGGFGAALLAFKHPDVFGVVSLLAPPLATLNGFQQEGPQFATDVWQDDPRYFRVNDPFELVVTNADQIRGATKIRLFCGTEDRYRVYAEDFHDQLTALNIPHEYKIVRGARHNLGNLLAGVSNRVFPFWKEAFPPLPVTPATQPEDSR